LRAATRAIDFQRRLLPVPKRALVRFSAQLVITRFDSITALVIPRAIHELRAPSLSPRQFPAILRAARSFTEHGERLAQRIRAGSVNVNEAYAATWGSVDSPIGGMKESRLRARHGAEGILKFTESQTVAIQRLLPVAPLPGMDVGTYARWMTRVLRLVRQTRLLG
jgi:hypothetical protein